MKKRFIIVAVFSVSCCREDTIQQEAPGANEPARREDGIERAKSGSAVMKADAGSEFMNPDDEQNTREEELTPYPPKYVDRMLEKTFGEAAQHTPDDVKLIEFVESYLSEADVKAFPRPHRHLVRRQEGMWVVSVMSLESLRTPGLRAAELLVYVRLSPNGFVVEKTAVKT